MYNIDEENSDVYFVVENNKVKLKIKHFESNGTEIPNVIGSNEQTAESDANVYSALRVKNDLEAQEVAVLGCTESRTMNEKVKELYLKGLQSTKYYFVSQLWNNNGYLQFRISESASANLSNPTVVLQVYTNIYTKSDLYRLAPQGGWSGAGLVRLSIEFDALPTVATPYRALLHSDYVTHIENAPVIKSRIEVCGSSYKGFLNGPEIMRSSVLGEMNQLTAVQRINYWHVDKYFSDGTVYFRGVYVRYGTLYFQIYDSKGWVHTVALGNYIPNEGTRLYKGEFSETVTDTEGSTQEVLSCYLFLSLNFDILDAEHPATVSGIRIENHTLYDLLWYNTFGNDMPRSADKALELATRQYGGVRVIYDENGSPYRLSVRSGSLSVSPIAYRNVLVLGNSITSHARATARGWYGTGFGMAASRASMTVGCSTDFVSHLKRGLATRYSDVYLSKLNIADWETTLRFSDFMTILGNVSLVGRDAIVLRFCENVPDGMLTEFYSALDGVITYIREQNASADLFLCGSCMSSLRTRLRGEVVRRYAVEHDIAYINVQCEYEELERVGHYTEGFTDTTCTAVALYPITDAGVAAHPNDLGHLHIANRILQAMHYPVLDREHPITVTDIGNIGADCAASWVENGILNVKTAASTIQGSYTDVAGNEQLFLLENHDDGMFTCVMPSAALRLTLY